jgi:hypothetical protein
VTMSTGGWPRPHFDVALCALGATAFICRVKDRHSQ